MLRLLAIKGIKNRKLTTILPIITIAISTFFTTFLFFYDNYQNIKQEQLTYQRYGKFHGIDYTGNKDFSNINKDIELTGKCNIITKLTEQGDCFGSFDKNMFELANFKLLEGRLPKNNKEVIIETGLLDTLNKKYDLHQQITVTINQKQETYTIVGIMPSYSNSWINDGKHTYPGMITTNKTSNQCIQFIKMFYDKVDNIYNLGLFTNSNSYSQLIPTMEGQEISKEELEIMKYNQNIKEKQLAFFITIIIVTNIIVILSIYSNSLKKRRKQLSLLRALGCKKKEIYVLLLYEGAIVAIMGVILGILLIIFLSIIINMEIMFFILFISVTLNFITALLGALLPCMRISKIELTGNFVKKQRKYINNKVLFFAIALCMNAIFGYYAYQLVGAYTASQYNSDYRKVAADYSIGQTFFDNGNKNDIWALKGYKESDVNKIKNITGIKEAYYEQGYSFPTNINDNGLSTLYTIGIDAKQKKELQTIFPNEKIYQDFITGKVLCYFVHEEINYELDQLGEKIINNNGELELDISINNITKKQKIILVNISSTNNFIVKNALRQLVTVPENMKKMYNLDNPYCTTIQVRASADANYEVTDKQMAILGFTNHRIEHEQISLQEKQNLLYSFVITMVVGMIGLGVLYNYWSGYIYSKRRDIGILKAVGFENSRVLKRYSGKAILMSFIACILSLLGVVVSYFIIDYLSMSKAYSTYAQSVDIMQLISRNASTMLQSMFIAVICIYIGIMCVICVYPVRQIVKKDIVANINSTE